MTTRTLLARGEVIYVKHVRRVSGSFNLNNTSWTDLDVNLDLTLPAQTGDVVEVGLTAIWVSNPVVGLLDVATLVSGSPVSYFSNGTGTPAGDGICGWSGQASATRPVSGWAQHTLLSGDISAGTVTLRLRYKTGSGTKTLTADTTDPLQFAAKNLGPAAP